MATAVYMYSSLPLHCDGRDVLEDDPGEFLGTAGEVTGGGSGDRGWNLDLMVFDDVSVERWIERLTDFLRSWGAPVDTYFQVYPPVWVEGDPARTVRVFPEQDIISADRPDDRDSPEGDRVGS